MTKTGFENVDGTYTLDDSDYEEITVNASTKIVRMDEDRDEISRYVDNTTTDLSINDLKDAKNYGEECSKVLVCSSKGTAKTYRNLQLITAQLQKIKPETKLFRVLFSIINQKSLYNRLNFYSFSFAPT